MICEEVSIQSKKSRQSSVAMGEQKQRAAKVTDDALKPGGFLSVRLDSLKEHFPDPAKKNARCSLHKWVGVETEKGITYCLTCNVNLCKDCFLSIIM